MVNIFFEMNVHRRFAEAVKSAGGASKVAKDLGVSRQYVYMLMDDTGNSRPSRSLERVISEILKIPRAAWDDA